MVQSGRHRRQQSLGNATVLDESLVQLDDSAVVKMMLESWLKKYFHDRDRYHSASLFCMIKIGEIDIVTLPLGRLNAIKTAISLDLLECISDSVRSRSLRQIFHLLRNEMLLSMYEGPIGRVSPRLQDLVDTSTYFNQYPALNHRFRMVQRRISQVKISPGEFRDFESRKMFVINYQTNRYARRIVTITFRTWHLEVISNKRMIAKLKHYLVRRSKRRCDLLDCGAMLFSWRRWRIAKIQRLNDRNEKNAIDAEHAGDLVDVQHGIAHSELNRIQDQLHAANVDLTAIRVAFKTRRVHQARLSIAVTKLGPKFALHAHLIGAMKRLVSQLFVSQLNRHLIWLDRAVRQRNFMAFHFGPSIAPGAIIDRRLQARAAALSMDPKWDMSSSDSLNRAVGLLEGDNCLLVRLIHGLHIDRVVTKTLLMNALLPVPTALSAPQSSSDLFQDVALIQSYHDTICWASSLKSDLSLPSTKYTLSQIPETLSAVRSSNIREWDSYFDLVRYQNHLLSNACIELIRGLHRNQRRPESHQLMSEADCTRLSALITGDPELDSSEVYEAIRQRAGPIRSLYRQALATNRDEFQSISWFEFWDLIRSWSIMKTSSSSDLSIALTAQIWVDVVKRNDDYAATQSKATAPSKPKLIDEYLMSDIDMIQWQAVLVRVVRVRFGTQMQISDALDLILLEAETIGFENRQNDWLCQVKQSAVRNLFNVHRTLLMNIFIHHCKQSARNPTLLVKMEAHELQQFWNQSKLVDLGISPSDLVTIFNQVTSLGMGNKSLDGESQGLHLPQFFQVIASFGCFFILKHLKPLHKSK